MSSKEFGVGATIPEVPRKICASRRHREGRLWSLCSIYWTRLVCAPSDSRKSNEWMFLQDFQIVTDKQPMQYLLTLRLSTNSGSVSSSTSPPQASSRREVETATGNSEQSASSSSSGPVLERSDGIAPGNWCGPPKTSNPSQRPKLRGLRANQNDKGSLWRSTSSRKRW